MNCIEEYGVDIKKSMAMVGNNKTIYAKLLKNYASSHFFEEFCAAIDSGDTATIHAKAHALKGVSGNMRFDVVYNLIKTIESEIKNGLIPTTADPMIAELKAANDRILAFAEAFVANPDALMN